MLHLVIDTSNPSVTPIDPAYWVHVLAVIDACEALTTVRNRDAGIRRLIKALKRTNEIALRTPDQSAEDGLFITKLKVLVCHATGQWGYFPDALSAIHASALLPIAQHNFAADMRAAAEKLRTIARQRSANSRPD